MDRETLLRKIRACMQLSKSANEHEAAAALRQAQALMREHGISPREALASDVTEREAKTGRRGDDVHESMHRLIDIIRTMFRCRSVIRCGVGSPVSVIFYGTGADPEIAAYAFDALRVRANREARGEAFRRGWVASVRRMLSAAENEPLTGHMIAKLEAYRAARFTRVQPAHGKAINGKAIKDGDFAAGVAAGKDARLHSGIGGTKQGALEHES